MRFTTDYGKTWNEFQAGTSMFGTFLLGPKRGWACGWNRKVYYTEDAGKNWVLKNCGIDPGNLDDIWFINDTLGWVVGDGVYHTISEQFLNPVIAAEGDTVICEGDSVKLYSTTDFRYYEWSDGTPANSIIVKKSRTYYLTVATNTCDSSKSNSIKVTVIPNPKPKLATDGPPYTCEGDSLKIYVDGYYTNYKWSNGSSDSIITVGEKGVYSVVVLDTNGCKGTSEILIDIKPNPKPIIKANSRISFCSGDSVVLSTINKYSGYKWHESSASIVISEDQSVTIKQSGKYVCIVVDSFGCTGVSNEIEVTVSVDSNRLQVLDYDGINPKRIDSTYLNNLNCLMCRIQNNSIQPYILRNPYLILNIKFSIPQSQLPIYFEPNEIKSLMICFVPTSLGICRDTLVIPDVCSDHIVPLVSYGLPNIFNGQDKCGQDITLKSKKIISQKFVTNAPYPNPTGEILNVSFGISKDIVNEPINYKICNSIGEIILKSNISNYNIESSDSDLQYGTMSVDMSNIQSGFYYLEIGVFPDILFFPVVLIH
jgi:hypothetical protein